MKKYMTIEEYFKTQAKEKGNNEKKKKLRILGAALCLTIIIFSLYTIFHWYLDNSKIQQINKRIDQTVTLQKNQKQGILVNPPKNKNSNYYYYASFSFYEVSFSILLSQNSDTVGFIHIRNTNVNYPIVQYSDNNYYLKHSFDKEKNDAGWIFLDYRNRMENLGDNTILYGHARLDGTLFGSLKNVLSSSWQKNKDNYVIFLSTPRENWLFQIFSIYTIKKEGYYITTNFSSSGKKQVWLNTMKERNIAPIDTEVDVKDKILTLSTCQDSNGGRIVVHAKLIKRQNRY